MSDAPPPGGGYQPPQQPGGGYQPPQPPQPPPAPSYQPPTYQAPPAQPSAPTYQQPAQFQPVNPGAKSGNGCLKAFLIISAISVVLGIIIVVVAVFLVADAVDEIAGTADPADYEITLDECSVSEFGTLEASGTITNKDSSSHGFLINVDFTEEGSTVSVGTGSMFVNSLSNGQSAAWDATGFASGEPAAVNCSIKSVEYWFG